MAHKHEYAGGFCRTCGKGNQVEMDHLTQAYLEFCNVNNLEDCSADEHDQTLLTQPQRDWINAFIELWRIQFNQFSFREKGDLKTENPYIGLFEADGFSV